jgi:hypothetical protein
MNCDQVFDVLTRGPFPTGTPCDAQVEAHLADCAECGRLAEALRPALELFQEAIGPEESRDLPGYWCAVATNRKQPIVSYAEEPAPPAPAPVTTWRRTSFSRHWSALAMWRVAAVLALGVTLGSLAGSRGVLVGGSSLPPNTTSAGPAGSPADDDRSVSAADHMELAALPQNCYAHPPAAAPRYTENKHRVLATANLSNLDCCTKCHNAASPAMPDALALVTKSCKLCHE